VERVNERENGKVLVKKSVFRVSKGEEQERESEVAIAACFIAFWLSLSAPQKCLVNTLIMRICYAKDNTSWSLALRSHATFGFVTAYRFLNYKLTIKILCIDLFIKR